MRKIPAEMDHLMWAVAENPTTQALDEFASRYPDHRGELLRRVEMVRGLRAEAKIADRKPREIPKFEPRPVSPTSIPRGSMVAVAGLAVAAFAFAGFTAFRVARPTPPGPPVEVKLEPIKNSEPEVRYAPSNPSPIASPNSPVAPSNVAPPTDTVKNDSPPAEVRKSLTLKDTHLMNALALVTAGTGLKLEIGPGFVDQKVTVAFQDMTPSEMLVKMAKDYAFTIYDEGGGHMLVLPVADRPNPDSGLETSRRVGP